MSAHSAGAYTATLLVMVNVMKGGWACTPILPAWANFTFMMVYARKQRLLLCVLCEMDTFPAYVHWRACTAAPLSMGLSDYEARLKLPPPLCCRCDSMADCQSFSFTVGTPSTTTTNCLLSTTPFRLLAPERQLLRQNATCHIC